MNADTAMYLFHQNLSARGYHTLNSFLATPADSTALLHLLDGTVAFSQKSKTAKQLDVDLTLDRFAQCMYLGKFTS